MILQKLTRDKDKGTAHASLVQIIVALTIDEKANRVPTKYANLNIDIKYNVQLLRNTRL